MTYPDAAGFSQKRETSRAAAAAIDASGARAGQCDTLLAALRDAGPAGLIAEEARHVLVAAGFRAVERGQASARLSDLCIAKKGETSPAVATDRKRISILSGKAQMVIVLRRFASPADLASDAASKAPRMDRDDPKAGAVYELALHMAKILAGKKDKDGFINCSITPLELLGLEKLKTTAGVL